MLELFKKYNPFTLFFVILYGFAIRSSLFFIDISKVVFDKEQAFSFVTDSWCVVTKQNLIGHYIISTSLLLIISIYLNVYLKDAKIIDRLGYLPTLFFMLVSACFSSFLYISNELIALLFFSISLMRLIQSLLIEETDVRIFDASFFMSVASLFYKPLMPCILIVFLSVIILKSVQIKALLFIVIGIIIPYFLLGVYLFMYDRLGLYLQQLVPDFFHKTQLFSPKDFLQIVKIIFVGICTLLGFVKIQAVLSKSTVNIRKYYSLLLIVSLVYIPMFLINKQLSTIHFIFLILPVSYYLLNFLKDIQRTWISELIHVALFVLIYVSNINY